MKKGSTLAEVLIAVAVLAAGVLALLGTYPLGLHSVRDAGTLLAATQLGAQVMEQELARPFAEVLSRPLETVQYSTLRHGQPGRQQFQYEVVVTPLSGTVPAKDVLVQVSWDSGSGLKSLRLESEVMEL